MENHERTLKIIADFRLQIVDLKSKISNLKYRVVVELTNERKPNKMKHL